MQLPRRRRADFEAGNEFQYPEHLREQAAAAPVAPGVYTFHGQPGDLPLYIGKSVNLRARLLSHLRNPDEDRMLRQASAISFERTAGEIGALLLEARLIKQQQPLYNQKLRRNKQLCALRLGADGRPELVYSKDVDFATTPELYGLYASRHAALEGLRALADEHKLCYAVLGLEKPAGGRGCFRSMLRQCAGACCGRESLAEHQARLLAALDALRIACWPHPGAIGLIERWPSGPSDPADPHPPAPTEPGDAMFQIHVVRNWCYLGSAATLEQARALDRVATGFDADGYKILCRPLLGGRIESLALQDLRSPAPD
jgi:excinuclease Cho